MSLNPTRELYPPATHTQPATHTRPVDDGIVDLILRPYCSNTRYLKQACAGLRTDGAVGQFVDLEGNFGIDESCYIDSTGHFNSVEANICVNQLSYMGLAWFIAQDVAHHPYRATLGSYTLDTFREKQLPSMFIVSLSTSFRRQIDPRDFQCSATWTSARRMKSITLLSLSFKFTDRGNGLALGDVMFALA